MEPRTENQVADWMAWCPEVKPGEVNDAPLTPVLYSSFGGGGRKADRARREADECTKLFEAKSGDWICASNRSRHCQDPSKQL